MITKDLIKQLQKLVDAHEPHVKDMGEHDIMIDVFAKNKEGTFDYAGFSSYIPIELSSDCCYHVLTAFDSAQPRKRLK